MAHLPPNAIGLMDLPVFEVRIDRGGRNEREADEIVRYGGTCGRRASVPSMTKDSQILGNMQFEV